MIKKTSSINISPLRYPGGKSRAVNILKKYIPLNTKEICSPFLGGASFELSCAKEGLRVYGYDIFEPLIDFWQCLLDDKNSLVREVKKYYPLKKTAFYKLQSNHINLKTKIERAAGFFVLNRSSFSGSTLSGGMSPGHPRFTESSIERLLSFSIKNFTVEKADFEESISKHKETLLYLDPPYLIKSALYGRKGDAHKYFNHKGLFEILRNRNKWILSYNNCPEIIDMYKDYAIEYPIWKYGMSNDKSSREILILSPDIADKNKSKTKIECQIKQETEKRLNMLY